ncbi:MAG: rhomboid family intramembrane serine protease [Chloroflexota bacterium]
MIRYRSSRGLNLGPVEVLISINLLLFIATIINGDLIYVFGLQTTSFLERPWTIITNMFIHGGLGHIFANMFTLYFFGSNLLELMGRKYFLIVYFCGGILGNVLFMLLANPFAVAIGASGAVFAVGGALTVLRPNLKVIIFPLPIAIPLWVAVIGGFLIMSSPGIAWQAHLGGLIFGLAAGYYFRRWGRRPY